MEVNSDVASIFRKGKRFLESDPGGLFSHPQTVEGRVELILHPPV